MKLSTKLKKWSLKKWKDEVWDQFSLYIRHKYSKRGMVRCYTCGVVKPIKEMQCGHGFGGRGNSILFDEEIVRPQCYSCNVMKGGEYDTFHGKLIEENGVDWFKAKLRQKSQSRQFTRQELADMYEYYRKLNEDYEKVSNNIC